MPLIDLVSSTAMLEQTMPAIFNLSRNESNHSDDNTVWVIMIIIIGVFSLSMTVMLLWCLTLSQRKQKLRKIPLEHIKRKQNANHGHPAAVHAESNQTDSILCKPLGDVTDADFGMQLETIGQSQARKNDMHVHYQEIHEWLENKVGLVQYFENFIKEGYETMDIIREITMESELDDIGIISEVDQHRIMTEIKKLSDYYDNEEVWVYGDGYEIKYEKQSFEIANKNQCITNRQQSLSNEYENEGRS